MKIYSYWNRKFKGFNQPIITDVPESAFILNIKRAILADPNKEEVQPLRECKLFYLGEFDVNSGLFDLPDAPVELMDCLEVFDYAGNV